MEDTVEQHCTFKPNIGEARVTTEGPVVDRLY